MTKAYLAIGSNIGDRLAYLQGALNGLRAVTEVEVVAWSRVYETAPIGGPEQDAFLNAVIAIDTSVDPYALLEIAHQLERDAERLRTVRWGPRTLDVDVLLYGDVVLDDAVLTIPHPRMWDRAFVLMPLHDVYLELDVDIPVDQSVLVSPKVLR